MRSRCRVLGVLSTAALLLASCGKDPDPTPGRPGARKPNAPTWRSFDEAREEARVRGLPLLVIVRQPGQPCPPADAMRDSLCAPAVFEGISVRTVADGGPGSSEAERRLVARSRTERTIPPLLVVATPDLDLLLVQSSRLFPVYDAEGRLSPFASDPTLTSDEVAALVKQAVEKGRASDARLAELARDGSPESRLERGEILAARGRWEEAGDLARNIVADKVPLKVATRIYDLLRSIGQAAEAQGLAARLLAWRAEEKGSGWLGLRLLRDSGDGTPETQVARLQSLIERAQRSGCRRLEASLRALRVRRLSASPDRDAALLAEDLAFLKALPADVFKSSDPEEGLFESDMAAAAVQRQDFEEAERWIRRLMKEHPEAPEATMYLHGELDRILKGRKGPGPVFPGGGAPPGPGPGPR